MQDNLRIWHENGEDLIYNCVKVNHVIYVNFAGKQEEFNLFTGIDFIRIGYIAHLVKYPLKTLFSEELYT